MKELKSLWKKMLMLGIPLLLGVIGFTLVGGERLSDGIFLTLCMYVMNYTDSPVNLWVELARWTAPIATASGVVLAIASVRIYLKNAIAYARGGSVAVYGPEKDRKKVLSRLPNGIEGEEEWVRAHRYILLHDEKTNFDFYQANRDKMGAAQVCIKCDAISPQLFAADNLHLFSPEEVAARLFWRRDELYKLSKQHDHQLKIVLVGFGQLGEQVLLSALQRNVFCAKQNIEYHIFGDASAFRVMHSQLESVDDPVIFHEKQWFEELQLLEQAHMVIVLEQQEQMELVDKLVFALNRKSIVVFGNGAPQLQCIGVEQSWQEKLSDKEKQGTRVRVDVFDWKEEALKPEYFFADDLLELAKRINLRYANLYMNVEETPDNAEKEWRKLNSFLRYSNLYAAEYHALRLQMMRAWGYGAQGELTPEHMEILAELEHIRWSRYHYINNWRLGTPANGRAKDQDQRIHTCLIPYEELPEPEKEKDRENIRVLLSVRR